MGLEENENIVYIIDFGLSKKYRSSKTLEHIKYVTNKKLTGNARFASINALKGCEQSRRDDLESIGYLMLYFLRGSLPWQGLKFAGKENCYKKICQRKLTTSPEALCYRFPSEFKDYINYTKGLRFDEEPDYEYLRNLLKSVLSRNDLVFDNEFDWTVDKKKKKEVEVVETEQVISDGGSVYENRKKNKQNLLRNSASKDNEGVSNKDLTNDDNYWVVHDSNRITEKNIKNNVIQDNRYVLISSLKGKHSISEITKSNNNIKVKENEGNQKTLLKNTYPQSYHKRNIRNNVLTFQTHKKSNENYGENCILF